MKVRFFIAILATTGLIALSASLTFAQPATGSLIFEVKGAGKLSHFETVTFGVKPIVTNITAAKIIECLQHQPSAIGCDNTTIEQNVDGKAYVIVDNTNINNITVYITTQIDCSLTTQLTGLVGGNGVFMFSGTHVLSNTQFIVQGKVNFARVPPNPPFTPVAIVNGTVKAVSENHDHYAVGTFRSVGPSVNTCP